MIFVGFWIFWPSRICAVFQAGNAHWQLTTWVAGFFPPRWWLVWGEDGHFEVVEKLRMAIFLLRHFWGISRKISHYICAGGYIELFWN